MSDSIMAAIRSLDRGPARVLRVLASHVERYVSPPDLIGGLPLRSKDAPDLVAVLRDALGDRVRIAKNSSTYRLSAADPAVLRWSAGPIAVDLPRAAILLPGWRLTVDDPHALAVAAVLVRRRGAATPSAELSEEALEAAEQLVPATRALRELVGRDVVSYGKEGWTMPRALVACLPRIEARLLRSLAPAPFTARHADAVAAQVGCGDAASLMRLGAGLGRSLRGLGTVRETDGGLALETGHAALAVGRSPGWTLEIKTGICGRRGMPHLLSEPVLGLVAALIRQGGTWVSPDAVAAECGVDVSDLDRVVWQAREQFGTGEIAEHPDHGLRLIPAHD